MDVKNYQGEERFYFSVCPVTLDTDNLVPCPECGSIFYRDAEAAYAHQATHQPMCRLLSKLSKLSSRKSVFHENPDACLQLGALAKLAFKRNLTQAESDQLIFPRVCGVCQAADVALEPCAQCGCVAYCCKEHQEEDTNHHRECHLLNQARTDYVFWQRADPSVWPGVLAVLDNVRCVPQLTDMQAFVDFILGEGGRPSEGRALSSLLSSPLTCAWAMQESGGPREEVTIHLVGSRRMEVSYLRAWLLILNLFPQMKTLRLILVGPECPKLESSCLTMQSTVDSTLLVELVPPCLYDEFAVSEQFKEPDLVAALNCGFILYKSWAASLPHMLRTSGAPLVFTEYYHQDCLDNLDMVEGVEGVAGLEVVAAVQVNRMASLDPIRAPTAMWGAAARSLSRGRVVMDNGHVAVVRRA